MASMAQMSCNLLDLSVKIFCNLCLTVIWMFLLNGLGVWKKINFQSTEQ